MRTAALLLWLFVSPLSAQANLEEGVAALRKGDAGAAKQQFEALVRAGKGTTTAYVYLGIADNQLGQFVEAEAAFRQALKLDNKSEGAHYNLALTLLSLHATQDAMEQFRTVLKLNPENASANYNLAALLAQAGRPAEAADYLENVRLIAPADQSIWLQLANIYIKTNNNSALNHLVAEATKLDDAGKTSLQLGQLLLQAGHYELAAKALNQGSSYDPNNWQTYDLRGQAAAALNQNDAAQQAYEKAIALNGAQAAVHYHLGQLHLASNDRFERAKGAEEIAKSIDLDPAQEDYYFTLGTYFFDAHDTKRTVALLTSAIPHLTPSVRFYTTLALAELESEGPGQAEPYIQKAIALDPKAGAPYDLLGRCRMRTDDTAGAAKYFMQAAKLTPENDIFSRDAAIALDKLGQSSSALPFAERSVKLRPKDVYNHYILGKLYAQCNRQPDAIQQLETCTRLNAQNALPYNLLATLYKRSGQADKAAACWRTLRILKQSDTAAAEQTFSRLGSVPQ